MHTVQSIAAEANTFLYRDTLQDKVLPQKDAPQWFTDLCHHAHGDMPPDDWRYEFIQDALTVLAEDGEAEDPADVDEKYPYTRDRLDWLASRLDRMSYCDEAEGDYGPGKDMEHRIALGMYHEMREVFFLVKNWLTEQAESDEIEALDASNNNGGAP